MPRRLTDDVDAIPVEGAADPADGAPAVPGQVPEALPDVPPPSNIVVEPTVPAVDIPVLKEVPGIEVPMPGDACGRMWSKYSASLRSPVRSGGA